MAIDMTPNQLHSSQYMNRLLTDLQYQLMPRTREVYGLYGSNWGKRIVTPAKGEQHPAKFSRKLIYWIYEHGTQQGYWTPGVTTILDPMAGVATGGIAAVDSGFDWVGIDIEQQCVDTAWENINLHIDRWGAEGKAGMDIGIWQGDARDLWSTPLPLYIKSAAVFSPPFGPNHERDLSDRDSLHLPKFGNAYNRQSNGKAEGNVAQSLTAKGTQAAVVTSPPYGNRVDDHGSGDVAESLGKYGNTKGQVGHMADATYWSMMEVIYTQLWQILEPGSVSAIVVKDFRRAGKRIPLCLQTVLMLESIGFTVFEVTRAMQIGDANNPADYNAEGKLKQYKGVFVNILEKQGKIPQVNWEEVLWIAR